MAFRMNAARDANGLRVTAAMIEQSPQRFTPPLTCWHCASSATTVKSYAMQRNKRTRRVAAHFRLLPRTEHETTCPLQPQRVVREIARDSHGLAQVQRDGTLRLVLPADMSAPEATPPDNEAPELAPARPVEQRITTVRPPLPPALNSAVRIAEFLRQTGNQPEAQRLFRIQYGRRTLSWSRFCHGPEESEFVDLHDRIQRGRLPHPVAVHGTVQSAGASASGAAYAQLAVRIEQEGGRQVDVCLRSQHADLLAPLERGMHVLALGQSWKIWHRSEERAEVQLWLEQHWQLAFWDVDDAGNATRAGCPPPVAAPARADLGIRPRSTSRPRGDLRVPSRRRGSRRAR